MQGPPPQPTVDPPSFALEVAGDPPEATVRVIGELDMLTAPRLERELDLLCERGYCQVDLDVVDLTFVAAAGLTVFARSDRRLRAMPGRLRLVGPTPRCRRLLALTGLDATLTIN
jgi:anti-sigma B factor antagonist